MTDIVQAATAIRTRFATQWASAHPTIPVTWGNISFQPPAGPWVRLSVLFGARWQSSMRTIRKWQQDGIVVAQVFVPINTGEGNALTYAKSAGLIFEGASFGGVTCRTAAPNVMGDDGNGWWQVNVNCEFYCRDEH